MVGLNDPVLALDFDVAAAAKLLCVERAAASELTEGLEEAGAGGQAKSVHW